ncbi:MAG TPA: ABC transporter permease subunit [Actinocrinis sp.]|nr:ABC transporter permease subunit [Actinocrinis sp.]
MSPTTPAGPAPRAANTSVIHDIGYKPYTGPRLGRRQIVRALYVHSLRSVFGLGRGVKAKIMPFFVLAAVLIPAALNVYMSSASKSLVLPYGHMAYSLMLFSVLFAAAAAPEIVSRDLRHHTLPLYFSRPLRRIDYPLAKMLALFSGLAIVGVLPVLVSYVGQVASATSGHEIWADSKAAFPGLFAALAQAALFSVISLLIASTTGRRVIATGVIAIFFLVSIAISGVLTSVVGRSWQEHTASCVVPAFAPGSPRDTGDGNVFGFGGGENGPPTALFTQLCPGIDPDADNVGNIDGSLVQGRPGFANITVQYQTPVYSTMARVGGLTSPSRLVEGTRIWVFRAGDGEIPNPAPLGPVYAAELLVLVLAAGNGLFLRYRKVSVS